MNPKGCIPRVVERLKAKEKEWIEEKVVLDQVGARADIERSASARSRSRTTICRWTTARSTSDRRTRRTPPPRCWWTPSR